MKAKYFLFMVIVSFTNLSYASGYSGYAIPTYLEYVNEGLLVYGDFPDINNCSPSPGFPIFISSKGLDASYFPTVSALLSAALHSKSEVQFYLYRCTTVSWHWGNQNEYINEAYTSGVYFKSPQNSTGVSPSEILDRLTNIEENLSSIESRVISIELSDQFVSGSFGPLVCARNITPELGSCPAGYFSVGIGEIQFGSAVGCQSDGGGDTPSIQVKPICQKAE